jgi:hypothetical protein
MFAPHGAYEIVFVPGLAVSPKDVFLDLITTIPDPPEPPIPGNP